MTKWYEKHYSNPYPDFKKCEELAAKGKVNVNQVKQWFVNVRRRTHNQFRRRRATVQKNNQEKYDEKNENIYGNSSETRTSDSGSSAFLPCQYLSYDLLNQQINTDSTIRYYRNNQLLCEQLQHQSKQQNSNLSSSDSYSYSYPNTSTPIISQNFCSSNYSNQVYLMNHGDYFNY